MSEEIVKIKIAPFGSDLYKEMLDVRDEVLRKPLGLTFKPDVLATEHLHTHIALLINEKVVATLVLNEPQNGKVKMRQVAVLEDYRGKGLGEKLVKYSEDYSRQELGCDLIYCHARQAARRFYDRLEYEVVGEQFEEIGIPHFKMQKPLN